MPAHPKLVLGAVVVAGVLLAGCHGASAPKVTKVGLVAERDAAGAAARLGLAACRRDTSAQVADLVPGEGTDAEQQLVLGATENDDAVIALGYPMADALGEVARRFPGTHFAIVDAVVDEVNVDSLTFDESQGAFLAGALAALVSRSHAVAFLGGADVALLQRSEAGFTAGAREIDPGVRVEARYVGSFTDRPAAAELAARLFDGGDDVVYVIAGKAGLGAIGAAKTRPGRYVIGADANQDALAPGKVLTSVLKRYDVAAERVCSEAIAQKPVTGHVVLGLADHGVSLTDMRYTRSAVGARNLARLDRIRAAIVAGALRPPSTRAELAAFKPVAVP